MVTATPEARTSRARATALSSSGRLIARVEIFSWKIRVPPAAGSAVGSPTARMTRNGVSQ
ncbi:hypothetical protein OHA77_40985 [Streptosporangium sp. NBC_01639]|uniref:hypothetical protein n=1 Tax=Streptosporangium sp. NBC_01639 TaxID=2975948 RepID=UPI0038702018|nr:hypothetical protein OHA77_40985 [Streptosporangium sp. NBC_01639]